MTFARLLRRRAGAQIGLLALVALLAGLVSATLVTVLGHVTLSAQAGLATALSDAGPTGAATQFATPRSREPAQQVVAAQEVLDRTLGGLPVEIQRSERSEALTAAGREVAVASMPQLAGMVDVVSGELGAVGLVASTSRATATLIGARVGDRLTLAGANPDAAPLQVQLTAIWDPLDPSDPRWFDEQDGAVWVGEATLDLVPATVRVRWTVVPDPARLSPAQVPALRSALAESLTALKADDAVDVLGVLANGDLDATLAQIDRTLGTVRALSLPATLLAVLVGGVVLAQLAALLTEVRRGELVLLRSRGASRRRLVTAAAMEGVVVGGLGAAPAAVAAALALRDVGAVPTSLGVGAPLVVGIGVAAVLGAVTWLGVRGPLRTERADRPLRGSARLGVVVLTLAAGGVAVWRLLDLGSPVRTVAGRASPEPLATAALALGLLAIAVVVGAAVPPAARAVSGLAARRRDLRVLPVQEIARRPTAHSTTAALVALAVATSVVVASFVGSWATLRALRTAVHNGAELRLVADAAEVPGLIADALAEAAADTDVDADADADADAVTVVVVAADTRTVTFGSVVAELVAVPASAWPLLPHSPEDEVFAADAAPGSSRDASAALALPAGELAVDLAVVSTAAQDDALGDPVVTAWVRLGPTVQRLALTATGIASEPATRGGTWRGQVPEPGDLLALDVQVAANEAYRVEVRSIAVDGSRVPVPARGVLLGRTPRTLLGSARDGVAVLQVPREAVAPGTTVRVAAVPDSAPSVVMTRALASALSLAVGDRTTFTVPGRAVEVSVAGVVGAVPGTDQAQALLVDLDGWTAAQLWTGTDVAGPREIWAWGLPGGSAALPGATSAVPGPAPLLDPALTAFRVATWATVALAAGGVLAAARSAARTRRPEIGVLRGVGVTGATQAWMRVAEQARVVVPAALGGALGGAGLAALVTAPLVSALDAGAVPLPVELSVDAADLAAWVGAIGLAALLVVASVARDTARRARTASPREMVT